MNNALLLSALRRTQSKHVYERIPYHIDLCNDSHAVDSHAVHRMSRCRRWLLPHLIIYPNGGRWIPCSGRSRQKDAAEHGILQSWPPSTATDNIALYHTYVAPIRKVDKNGLAAYLKECGRGRLWPPSWSGGRSAYLSACLASRICWLASSRLLRTW